MIWYPRELALYHLLVKTLHVISAEGRNQSAHFVEHTAQRPYVTLGVVWHVAPNLWTRIVRSSCLCIAESFLNNFRDVEISKLGLHVLEQKEVCAFHISVEDAALMECPQSSYNLNKDIPDLFLLDVGLSLLIVTDFLENVSVVCILHHETQTGG